MLKADMNKFYYSLDAKTAQITERFLRLGK